MKNLCNVLVTFQELIVVSHFGSMTHFRVGWVLGLAGGIILSLAVQRYYVLWVEHYCLECIFMNHSPQFSRIPRQGE